MSVAAIETAVPLIYRPQKHALDRAATGIGKTESLLYIAVTC